MTTPRSTSTPRSLTFALALAVPALLGPTTPTRAQIPAQPLVPMPIRVLDHYDAVGPEIDVGAFSDALQAVQTLDDMRRVDSEMRASWNTLPFEAMYVASIRYFDLGSRPDAVYWFYAAQFRARLVVEGISRRDGRRRNSPEWQLHHSYGAFHEVVGRYVNGVAYCDLDELIAILETVRHDATVPDFARIYPEADLDLAKIRRNLDDVADGLEDYAKELDRRRDRVRRARAANGMDATFCGPDALKPGPPIEARKPPTVDLPPPVVDDELPEMTPFEPLEGSPFDVRIGHANPGWFIAFEVDKPLAELRYRTSLEDEEQRADLFVTTPTHNEPFDVFIRYRIEEGDPLLGPFHVHIDPQKRLVEQLRAWLESFARDEWVRVTYLGTTTSITKTELHFGALIHARCAIESVVYGIDTMEPDIPFYLEPCDLLEPTYSRGETTVRHSGKATYVSVQIRYRDGTVSKVRWY